MGYKIRIRNRVEVLLWAMVVMLVSVMGTHLYFVLMVPGEQYSAILPHPLVIAVILGFALGWLGCWQIMVGQNHHIELRKITDYDSLTGVLTRGRFFESARKLDLARAAVLMVDVDKFKGVNDSYGHPCGDAVLERVARMIQSGLRRDDLVGRYGGEEFAVALPDTAVNEANALAERLRRTIELSAVDFEDRVLSVTISVGLAVGRKNDGIDDLIARADAALLAAKSRGRNRVVVEHDMVPIPGSKDIAYRRTRSVSANF